MFEKPEMEIIKFSDEDIIVTSDCQGLVDSEDINDGQRYVNGTTSCTGK